MTTAQQALWRLYWICEGRARINRDRGDEHGAHIYEKIARYIQPGIDTSGALKEWHEVTVAEVEQIVERLKAPRKVTQTIRRPK